MPICRSTEQSSSGFIASVTSPDVYHCSDDVPGYRWIIRARSPQRINLTLYDFSPSSSAQSNPPYDAYGDSAAAAAVYEDAALPWPPPPPPPPSSPGGVWIDAAGVAPTEMCQRTGLIEEEEATGGVGGRRRTMDICTGASDRVGGGRGRISHLYLSEGSDVRIWLANDVVAEGQEDRFLIYFAGGC